MMTQRSMRAAAGALLLAASLAGFAKEPAPNKALHALFDREFKHHLDEHPEQATILGIEGYDHRLTDQSPAAVARRRAHVKKVIAELKRFDPKSLATQDRISRDVALDKLVLADQKNELYGELPFEGGSWLPVSPMHGPQSFFPHLARAARMRTAPRALSQGAKQ